MKNFNPELAVERVVNIFSKYYMESKKITNEVNQKELNDIVTKVDIFMENNIIKELSKFYPTHSFNAEESGKKIVNAEGDFYEWLIDPIDGTVNYAAGFPDFGVVAALQKNGETILGVTMLPELNEVYTVIKGKGAFCNGKRLHVSNNKNLSDSMVMVYIGSTYKPELISKTAELIAKLTPVTRGIRIVGSSSVASSWIASGKVDAIINLNSSISLGSTAGRLCISEANGKITNIFGNERKQKDSMVCSNGLIHDEVLNIINSVITPKKVADNIVENTL